MGGGALIYIKDHMKLKRRPDLEELMYKSRELESVFIEVINERSERNYGCVYRDTSMEVDEFNDKYISPLLEKIISWLVFGFFHFWSFKYNNCLQFPP